MERVLGFSLMQFYGLLIVLSMSFLSEREEIAQWIDQLGSRRFSAREKASKQLLAAGRSVIEPLKRALVHPDLEVRRRAEGLLRQLYNRFYGPIQSFTGHTNHVISVTMASKTKAILSGANDKSARLWSTATGKEIRQFFTKGQVWAVDIDYRDRWVLTGDNSPQMTLWDLKTGERIRDFSGHVSSVRAVRFSPNGNKAVSGSYDNKLRIWEVATGKLLHTCVGHKDSIMSVDYAPNGKQVASGGGQNDRTVRLWNVETGKMARKLEGHSERIMGVVFSPDDKWIISGAWDKTVRVWDRTTGKEVRRFKLDQKIYKVAASPDGHTILAACGDGSVRRLDRRSGKEIFRYEGHSGPVKSVAIGPNGKTFLSSSEDTSVILWPLD